jgi:integrase
MAFLQERNGSYRILFFYHGKLHSFTVGKVEKDEAEAKARQVDYLLMRLKQKLVAVPDGTDIVSFVEHDGTPPEAVPTLPATRQVVTVRHLKDRYLDTHGNGTIESNSLDTCRLHLSHFCRVLGDAFPLGELGLADLQGYVNRRAGEKVAPVTIRKEMATVRAAWNWGEPMGLTEGRFPNRGRRYPKADEKPPFMTMAELERHLAGGGNPEALWDCLYLTLPETRQLLEHVAAKGGPPWLYPMVAFAAYTGARRSEIIRVQRADVDLVGKVVVIREKKRSKAERTMRRVPLKAPLRTILEAWLATHPGGQYLFAQAGELSRSKKRSRSTGHQWGEDRATSLKGRKATIRKRENVPPPQAITRNEAHDHLKRVLRGGKWEVVRGWHTLRHSFISACASKGVDQRLVQEWAGHMDEKTSRRYRHLYPSVQQDAMDGVFGV